MARWTLNQVAALAPDDSATKAAKGLATPRTWSEMGSTDDLVWGKCQGSGKTPYQVTVDLNGPAFRCTCPSRKFPCKHGLALLMLWAANDGAVGDSVQAAPFADEWASQRSDKSEKQAARADKKAEQLAAEAADPALRAKREAARIGKVSAGLDDVDQWLEDLLRQGLATVQNAPYSFWDAPAGRLVDAQAPGFAVRLRELASVALREPDWTDQLVSELGKLHLLVEGWRRRDTLPEDLAADVRTTIGWTRSLDEIRLLGTVEDDWVVVGVRQDGENKRIRSQRTWLWGAGTQQWVVIVDFATSGGGFGAALVSGVSMHTKVSLFPGSTPKRGLCDDPAIGAPVPAIPLSIGYGSMHDLASWIASAIGANPWIERIPVVLHNVKADVDESGERGILTDADGATIRIGATNVDTLWKLTLHALNQPCSLVAEYEDGVLWPMGVSTDDGWFVL
jgi:SWIM zinc finger